MQTYVKSNNREIIRRIF